MRYDDKTSKRASLSKSGALLCAFLPALLACTAPPADDVEAIEDTTRDAAESASEQAALSTLVELPIELRSVGSIQLPAFIWTSAIRGFAAMVSIQPRGSGAVEQVAPVFSPWGPGNGGVQTDPGSGAGGVGLSQGPGNGGVAVRTSAEVAGRIATVACENAAYACYVTVHCKSDGAFQCVLDVDRCIKDITDALEPYRLSAPPNVEQKLMCTRRHIRSMGCDIERKLTETFDKCK